LPQSGGPNALDGDAADTVDVFAALLLVAEDFVGFFVAAGFFAAAGFVFAGFVVDFFVVVVGFRAALPVGSGIQRRTLSLPTGRTA